MKTSRLALCIVLLVPALGACTPGSSQPQSTLCSQDRELISYVDAEWRKKWEVEHKRTTTLDNDCIEWSGGAPSINDWITESIRSFHADRAPPVGAITGTPEENANLKKALKDASVPFSTKTQGHVEWIFWDESDAEKARAVVKRTWGRDMTPSANDPALLAEARKSWTVDDKGASAMVLNAYPGILSNAYVASSVATFTSRPLPGFEDAGKYAWIVLITCNSGRMHARFFVNPISGALVASVKPGDKDSVSCT